MKKRYEYIWECGRMRVFEYDGMVLCHEYRGYPMNEGYTILAVPVDGGFINRSYPYRRRYISCMDAVRIDHAPRSMAHRKEVGQLSLFPAKAAKAKAEEKAADEWEQISLL